MRFDRDGWTFDCAPTMTDSEVLAFCYSSLRRLVFQRLPPLRYIINMHIVRQFMI